MDTTLTCRILLNLINSQHKFIYTLRIRNARQCVYASNVTNLNHHREQKHIHERIHTRISYSVAVPTVAAAAADAAIRTVSSETKGSGTNVDSTAQIADVAAVGKEIAARINYRRQNGGGGGGGCCGRCCCCCCCVGGGGGGVIQILPAAGVVVDLKVGGGAGKGFTLNASGLWQ